MIDINRTTNDYAYREPLYQRRPLATVIATLFFIVVVAIVLSALGQAFFAKPAHASDTTFIAPPSASGWMIEQGGVRVWGEGPLPNPYIRSVPQPELQADKDTADARERAWVKACEPKLVRDHYGVQRYTYSKPGCEFGSPE